MGEALRLSGQLELASQVAIAGLEIHPELADAHDLYARVLVDAGNLKQAEEAWNAALVRDERHGGAHKGLGFLCYRRGEIDGALDHLELALAADPTDARVVQALRTVRAAPAPDRLETATGPDARAAVFAGLEGADYGLLLADARGRVLGGGLKNAALRDVTDEVAAHLAGVSMEAERTTRLLELGSWMWIIAEGPGGNMYLTQPAAGSLLLLVRDRSVPSGRLAMLAEKATAMARDWLEGQGL